jgi:hypothetical protein
MSNLISKDEDLNSSPIIIGYKVLRFMKDKKVQKISVFDVAEHFKNQKWFTPKSLYFGMLFLFSVDIIDFNHSYISRK